ncbi:MAG: molybdopterin oxidoreductase family protein [Rhodospirillaceae bacterium]|nr:molybdopterin oxidoreductase family protein [Rhodospirillales bacterium]
MSLETAPSVCPHDCPSACPLDVERLDPSTIGRLRGAAMPYTEGVICAKVARYAERVHNPDRILTPLKRMGAKGSGVFAPIGWDEALDTIADKFRQAAAQHGPEAVWPYFYAGTMGLVQRGGTNRLRRAMGYSNQAQTICATIGGAGWQAGVGARRGVDPREMVDSDLIVIWGGNPAATQVHLMGLISQARKARGAKLVVVDPYRTPTAEKADQHLMLKPGTDGALACAVMHVLFRDGYADRDYMARYTQDADRLEAHVATRGPAWASTITGLSVAEIETFAALYGRTKRAFLRLGYGMTRSRNGAVNLHAVSCLPAITGAWAHPGGGAVQSLSGAFVLDRTVMDALDIPEPKVRILDMCEIGPVLTGDATALKNGPPVTAMIIQNSNPANVAPETGLVWQGFAREDLFLAVHEQVMTTTAKFADIVLPATTFLEHADLYTSYGHTFLQAAKPVIAPLGEARSNHWVVAQLAQRLGAHHASFEMEEWALVDACLTASNLPGADALHAMRWLDCAPSFEQAHFTDGFGHGGFFRFAPQWGEPAMPALPDHWDVVEAASDDHPFRLITPPSRHFLNTSFNETPSSRKQAGRPTALIHHDDAARLGIAAGQRVRLGNRRGSVLLHAQPTDGIARGVVAVEGVWANEDFLEGIGINRLIGSQPVAPAGGGAFHDSAVWLKGEEE